MVIKSIRTRLTLWYVFVLTFILILFCLFLYASIRYHLNRKINHSLWRQAHRIADAYHTESGTFLDLPEHDYQSNPLIWFRLIKLDGSLFRPAPSFGIFHYPFPRERALNLPSETPLFDTIRLADGSKFRTIIFPVEEGMKRVGWIQLVTPISDTERTLTLIRNYMFFLVPLTIFILAISGNFLARKSLRPVDEIRNQVDRIYERNLSLRIQAVNPDDELGQLTQTFNRMLERLQLAFESQRRFLADASHELKTPITVLRSQWEKLSERDDLPLPLKRQIHTDIEELARLAKLVDNLLLLTAVEDDRVKIEQQSVDLHRVLSEVYEDGKILAESKKQTIRLNVQDKPIIIGDKNRLLQLFLNLVDNAVKYTPQGGNIQLSLYQRGEKIVVEIRDNGIGIPAKDLPYLFNRFYRVDKSRSRQLGGTGLGLSISQWIVQAHEGEINIESEPGEGTRVEVVFNSTHFTRR